MYDAQYCIDNRQCKYLFKVLITVSNLASDYTSNLKDCYVTSGTKTTQIISHGATVKTFRGLISISQLQEHNLCAFDMKLFRLGKSSDSKFNFDMRISEKSEISLELKILKS